MQDGNNGTDDRTPLQTGLESDVTLKLNESLYEVCDWNENSIWFVWFCKERDHRPRTVLDQLYNYKGGIVPNAVEAEKTTVNQQVNCIRHDNIVSIGMIAIRQ